MSKQIQKFDSETFHQDFKKALTSLKIDFTTSTIAKEIHQVRTEFYQKYLEETCQDDSEEQLLKFFESFEFKDKLLFEKFIELNCINNFNQNASKCLVKTIKDGVSSRSAEVEVSLLFYEEVQKWMATVELFRNTLFQLNFYIEDISVELLGKLEEHSKTPLSYHLSVKQILLILFFKLIRFALKNATKINQSLIASQFFVSILFVALSMVFGISSAKLVAKTQTLFARGFLPAFMFAEFVDPFNLTDKLSGYLDQKEGNVYFAAMTDEVRKSAAFLKGVVAKLTNCLEQFAKIRNRENLESQSALDQKLIILMLLQALVRGTDIELSVFQDFINCSGVKFVERGNGWVEVEDVLGESKV